MARLADSLLIAAFLAMLVAPALTSAANHYVTPSGVGSKSGADWGNACAGFTGTCAPSSMVRGDTYYVATGNYGSYTFNKAASGTQYITIKKATTADHGSTDPGWQSSYGNGQAVFAGSILFSTDYWIFDGQKRDNWESGYGFRVNSGGKIIRADGDHITITYVDMVGTGPDDASGSNDGFYAINSQNDLRISYCRIFNVGRAPILGRGFDNFILEYSMIDRDESCPDQHSEGVSLYGGDGCNNNIFRHNIWRDIEGTGVIVVGDGSGNQFYGNLIYWTSSYPWPGQDGGYIGNGAITSWTVETHSNSKYYDNTVIIPPSGGLNFVIGNMPGSSGTGNIAINNLYACSGNIGSRLSYDDGTSHSYNAYSGNSNYGEATAQTGITPSFFVDFYGYDFRLARATNSGQTLSSPYNIDPDGNVRGADGVWDIGAYEYTGGSPAPTAALSASPSSINAGQSSTLSWSSTNANSCTASGGWSGTKATSGTQTVSPSATTTYSITCTGAGGTSPAATATVTVSSSPVNGACGSATRTYAQGETFPGDDLLCSAGTPPTTTPTLGPSGGATATWTCAGQNGGTNASCTATRSASILQNGDFESFTGGTADYWTDVNGGAAYTLAQDTGRTGSAQLITITAAGGWGMFYYQKPPLVLGKSYTWTFWYKTSGSNPLSAQVVNAQYTAEVLAEALPGTGGTWQKAEFAFTYNNSAADMVRVSAADAGSYWVDDMTLTEASGMTHPADTDKNWTLSTGEVSIYNLCWKTPTCVPSPATTYVSNANLMWKSRADGAYHYAGGSCPLCWVSGA